MCLIDSEILLLLAHNFKGTEKSFFFFKLEGDEFLVIYKWQSTAALKCFMP